jgi:TolB-like protein/Tfp pilus assembly protein PilF
MLTASTRLGPYEIVGPLGAGGMGEVYRARDARLGREVAVKVLPELFADDPERRARFEREARAVAALSHPNILAIHDYGTHGAVTYAVMELLEGETLRSRLAKGPLPWREVIEVGGAVADGLAAAHAKGIVHRDLKPENLFLTADGRVKILDFGLARVETKPTEEVETAPYLLAQTAPGTVLGTIGYMSPEQVRGLTVDARSDVFSLGCVLYEMLAGRRPFQRKTAADTTAAILSDEPRELAGLGIKVPPEVERAVRLCLAKKQKERFQSAQDCALALRTLLSGSDVPSPFLPTKSSPKRRQSRPRKAIDSLAVLPLFNASDDPDMEYLSDGITESIISNLSQLPKLRVMARSTVFRFKGRDVDACAVGRELNVRAVLTGRMLQRGDQLILRAELVDTADGAQLWGEQYNRPLADLLAVEEEIAREIVHRLRLHLPETERRRLGKRTTINTEAYQLYLRGRYYLNKRTEEGMKKSIDLFQQAIDLDPTYALAYAGIADTYLNLGGWGQLPPYAAYPKAKAAAAKALEIDETLAEAHTSLAMAAKEYDWDFPRAERAYRRALELNPNYAVAHHWYGECLAAVGRHAEAIAEIKRALELDPLSLIINASLGRHGYFFAGQYDQAIEQCQKTIDLDPHFWVAHHFLGGVYACAGRLQEALAAFTRAQQLEPNLEAISCIGLTYGTLGRRAQAQAALDELNTIAKTRYVSPINFALVYIGLGEKDEAFGWLEKALEHHTQWLSEIRADPFFDSLRSDPRFKALLRDVGFPATETADDRPIDSLAILPLVNAAADPNLDYLSDGITESLINLLSRLPRLRVMARSTVFRYKGRDLDAQAVGRALNVRAVLLGRVSLRDNRVLIKADLVVVADGSRLWGEDYDRDLAEVGAVEEAIAKEIAENLRLRLNSEQKKRLTKRQTQNAEAYQLYLKGRYHWNKRTEEGLKKAVQCLEEALAIDPAYALAYAGLADCYNLPHLGALTTREAGRRAKAAAVKALEFDANLAEAHASLAFAKFQFDWDWAGAESGFKRAIELNPNYARAHHAYGSYLLALGRFDEALAAIKRAEELDPLSLIINHWLAFVYYNSRRFDRAIEQCHKTLELDAQFAWAHSLLGLAYGQKGMYAEAFTALEEAWRLDEIPEFLASLGYTLAKSGQREKALKALDQLQVPLKGRPVAPYEIATIYAGLDDKEQAFACLEKAYEDRGLWLPLLRVDPMLDSLHSDPRFADLLRRMNFPP